MRTTISPTLQRVAAEALGGQLGGVVAMDPANGEILAVAGLGIDDLQPPGSTFKMVTVTAALEAKVASLKSVFPYATSATLDGVKLENANGEDCGGSLALAFAVSCNSVFAPLGVKVGADRLVATAESFGFNHPPGLPGAVESTLPPASQIQGELDLGSTSIGQGQVQASALQMVRIAATVGDGGRRPTPTFEAQPSTPVRVMSAATARTVRSLMIGVVREGTGTAAAIPGVVVAGKTGTAELGVPACPSKSEHSSEDEGPGRESQTSGENEKQSDENCSTRKRRSAEHRRLVCGLRAGHTPKDRCRGAARERRRRRRNGRPAGQTGARSRLALSSARTGRRYDLTGLAALNVELGRGRLRRIAADRRS